MENLHYYNLNLINRDKYYLFRYFPSIDRLKSFLTNGIYLGRADKYSDNLECVTKSILTQINRINGFRELITEHNPHLTVNEVETIKTEFENKMKELANELTLSQKKYFISSWYIEQSSIENELMWRSYGSSKNDKGYLVRINLKHFLEHFGKRVLYKGNIEGKAFSPVVDKEASVGRPDVSGKSSMLKPENTEFNKLVVGQVKYFDFTNDENIKEVKYAGFRKHFSFKGENEFRLLTKREDINAPNEPFFLKQQRSFYEDIIIFCHPSTDYNEYINLREEVRTHNVNLNLSQLDIWYKLKAYSK